MNLFLLIAVIIPFPLSIRSAPLTIWSAASSETCLLSLPSAPMLPTPAMPTSSRLSCPGFKKEDIKIDVEDDCLTISAERKVDEDKKDEKNNFVKRERYYGSYSRSFDVSGINIDGIEASYTDGVLTLTMPKKASEVPASRRLEIK